MSLTERQKYKDVTYTPELALTHDIFQLKYDGWWDRIVIKGGIAKHYSRTGRLFQVTVIDDDLLNCTLVGEAMFGTQWSQQPQFLGDIFLFDIWELYGEQICERPYDQRFCILSEVIDKLPYKFRRIHSRPIKERDLFWSKYVETKKFEGLVYRNSKDSAYVTLLREKRAITEDLQAVGFERGQNRLSDTLGAIIGKTKNGVTVKVGSGLTDSDRYTIWNNRDKYLNRWFEVGAKLRFESGSLRHPTFKGWRDDLSG